MDEGVVGGHSLGVDASLIPANANQTRGVESKDGLPADLVSRAVDEYLETLNDVAFGAATKVIPKYISPVDPAAPVRPTEARAAREMIDRVHERFGIKSDKLVGDTGYGSVEMLGWLVEDRKIAPHIPTARQGITQQCPERGLGQVETDRWHILT